MADWFLILLAMVLVVTPFFIGAALGHIPKNLVSKWAFSLAGATFLLVFGVFLVERELAPFTRLVVSIAFGILWIGAGIQLSWLERAYKKEHDHRTRSTRYMISTMFIAFGTLWIILSIYQYF